MRVLRNVIAGVFIEVPDKSVPFCFPEFRLFETVQLSSKPDKQAVGGILLLEQKQRTLSLEFVFLVETLFLPQLIGLPSVLLLYSCWTESRGYLCISSVLAGPNPGHLDFTIL